MTVTDLVRGERGRTATSVRPAPVGSRAAAGSWVLRYRWALVGGDALVVLVATVVALATAPGAPATPAALGLLLGLPGAWLLLGSLTGAYRAQVLADGSYELRAVLLAGVLGLASLSVLGALGVTVPAHLVATVIGVAGGAGLVRFGGRSWLRARRRDGACRQRVVLAGEVDQVATLVDQIRRASIALEPVAVLVPAHHVERAEQLGMPVVALAEHDPEPAVVVAAEHLADAVLLVPGGEIAASTWRAVARACEWRGLQIMFSPAIVDVATSAPVTPVAGLPVLAVPRPGPAGAGQVAKAVVDRLGAGLGLLLLLPVLAAIAVAVRLDSAGPVLFRQVRIGQDGRPFRILKFRTMWQDAEHARAELEHLNEHDGPLFKLQDDPRVTRVGRILRRTSLDELPQLVNVLLGHMSLVGPRPPLPREVAAYSRAERRRLLVKPGITGLWQVGGRSTLGWADTVQLDIRYVESWSLPLDLRILARTLPAVARGTGAY